MLTKKTLQRIMEKLRLPTEGLVTVEFAARDWGVHVRTMQRWVAASKAKAGSVKGRVFVRSKTLEDWVIHQFKENQANGRRIRKRPPST